jgi:hypothetical protein
LSFPDSRETGVEDDQTHMRIAVRL